jgi:Abnormal spindle-like microcephaly-assoc'd, ASPM-SPD-2-Hydin
MNGVYKANDRRRNLFLRIEAKQAARVAGILPALLALFGLLGTSGCIGYAGKPAAISNGGLQVTPNAINFGSVGVGSSAKQNFIVSNRGSAQITLKNVSAIGSGFGIAGFSGSTVLAPGHSLQLTAAFKPTSAGQQNGSISVTTATQSSQVMGSLTGMGATSALSMTPSAVGFGKVSVGSPSTQTLRLTNDGNESVAIKSVTATGNGFSESGLSTPQTLTPNQSVTFTVEFDPKSAGEETGTLSVTASGATIAVNLNGVGVASSAQLVPSTTSVPFGNVAVGTTATQQVTLTSSGNTSVDISSVSLAGSGYTFTGVAAHTILAPDQSAILKIDFDPKTSGNASGTVTISSNAPNSPLIIHLTGDGTQKNQAPSVALSWDSASQVIGYFVYRSSKSSGPYTKLNSQVDSATSYTDSSVTNGNTYYYVVTSVNAENVQSTYSKQISVTIPAQ